MTKLKSDLYVTPLALMLSKANGKATAGTPSTRSPGLIVIGLTHGGWIMIANTWQERKSDLKRGNNLQIIPADILLNIKSLLATLCYLLRQNSDLCHWSFCYFDVALHVCI